MSNQDLAKVLPQRLPKVVGELEDRFGLIFEILDRNYITRMRRERGFGVNPWRTHSRFLCRDWLPSHVARIPSSVECLSLASRDGRQTRIAFPGPNLGAS